MATIRNVSDFAFYVGVGRKSMVWVEPDETFTVDDDAVENYEIVPSLYEVVPDVSAGIPSIQPPVPPVPAQESPE